MIQTFFMTEKRMFCTSAPLVFTSGEFDTYLRLCEVAVQLSDPDAHQAQDYVHAVSLTLGLYEHEAVLAKRALD